MLLCGGNVPGTRWETENRVQTAGRSEWNQHHARHNITNFQHDLQSRFSRNSPWRLQHVFRGQRSRLSGAGLFWSNAAALYLYNSCFFTYYCRRRASNVFVKQFVCQTFPQRKLNVVFFLEDNNVRFEEEENHAVRDAVHLELLMSQSSAQRCFSRDGFILHESHEISIRRLFSWAKQTCCPSAMNQRHLMHKRLLQKGTDFFHDFASYILTTKQENKNQQTYCYIL